MAEQPAADYTLTPARPADVRRLNSIMSALGLARPEKKAHRIDALTYVLDEFEKSVPQEVSRYLNPPSAGARRR